VKKRKQKRKFSFREVAKEAGVDRASVPKWCGNCKTKEEAIAVCLERKKPAEEGLSWFQQKAKEETIRLRRLNEIEENTKNRSWVAMKTLQGIVSLIMNQLEQLPGRVGSQLGLDGRQVAAMQRLIDEVRLSAAKEIESGGEK